MTAAEFPIFLVDGHDVTAVATHDEVVKDLEPFLVHEPVRLLDALARPLQLVVRSRKIRLLKVLPVERQEVVGVEVTSDQPDEAFLRDRLTHYLHAVGSPVPQATSIRDFAEAAAPLIH